MSLVEELDKYKELEDGRIWSYLDKHNQYIKLIDDVDMDSIGSFQLAKCEYWYSKAQLYAALISGHYRKQQKYYEAMAEQAQANEYERVRLHGDKLKTGTDAQYLSRMAKGKELENAAKYEGDYIRWKGIADSYESSINSIKDMIKSLDKENKGGV
jgi:hypothetical protein